MLGKAIKIFPQSIWDYWSHTLPPRRHSCEPLMPHVCGCCGFWHPITSLQHNESHVTNRPCMLLVLLLWHWDLCVVALAPQGVLPSVGGTLCTCSTLFPGGTKSWCLQSFFKLFSEIDEIPAVPHSPPQQPSAHVSVFVYICTLICFLCFVVWRLGKWVKTKWMLRLWSCECKFLLQMKQKKACWCLHN